MSRPSTAWLPKEFSFWPDHDEPKSVEEIQRMYDAGYAGAWRDDAEKAALDSSVLAAGGNMDGMQVATQFGLAETGKGKLIIPFVFVDKHFPGAWPGAAQQCGDCVGQDSENAGLLTLACDIEGGLPDEITGLVEGVPEIPAAGLLEGAFAPEAIYWYRGYDHDGWSCEAAARVMLENAAMWVRKDYPELGIDLTHYSKSSAHRYGSRKPPGEFTTAARAHLLRSSTRIHTADEVRDYLANGFGISTCGGESFSNVRDKNGVSSRTRKGWSHAMSFIGFDDRDIIKQVYGEPTVLVLNQWGEFNSGPRTILGTNILIPKGSFWARWSDVRRRSMLALSGAAGWARKKLDPFKSSLG